MANYPFEIDISRVSFRLSYFFFSGVSDVKQMIATEI